MADISTRMSVSGISQYKSAMQQAAQSVKTLDAQLKQADAEFKATGDKEKYMADKAKILEERLKAQKNAAKNAQEAMKLLAQNGDTTSTAYQKMAQQLAEAETGILDTTAAINNLQQGEQQAAKGADQLTASVQGISKKISLEQVINGVNKITSGLENAAKKAVELGKAFAEEIMERAAEADDIMTKSNMYGLTPERYQAMQKLANTWSETSVEAIMKARQRVQGRMGSMTDDLLGIGVNPYVKTPFRMGDHEWGGQLKDWEDIFWEAGDALLHMEDSYKRAEKAETIFGRRWEELVPMFTMGREAYEKALDAETTNSAKALEDMAKMNDTINDLKDDFKTLETEVLAGMAPNLTKVAEVVDSLLDKLMQYLKTEDGQAMLEKLGESVSGLFEDLSNIDPESVVNNFVSVFQNLVNSFEWISKNWTGVETGLKAIVGVWAAGKVTSGALTIIELLNGLKGLTGGGGAGGAVAAGLTSVFKNAFIGALPALGAITLGTIAITAGAVILGGSFNSQKVLEEAARRGKEQNAELKEFNETVAEKSTNEGLKAAHETLAGYVVPGGKSGVEELVDLQEFARRYIAATRDGVVDPMMDAVSDLVFDKGQEYFEEFAATMEAVLANEVDYTGETQQKVVDMVTDLMDAVREQMSEEVLQVELEPDVQGLQKQLSTAKLAASVTLGITSGGFAGGIAAKLNGMFANGLPFVPWDGYIAMLHRGERVLTARENRNYTFNNNTYFGGVNLHNGLEVEALTESMAAQNAKVAAGYGAN